VTSSTQETSGAPVYIDFSLERGDLFRANLHMIENHLLMGIVILSLYSAGVVYMFVFLDELGMLVRLSPLFIGFPIMAVAGQVLRVHATCRKYFQSLPESQRRVSFMFTSNADGYDRQNGASFSHIAWSDVLKVVEQSVFFLIYFNRYQAHIIPKRGFHQDSDIPRFKSIVRSELGHKAMLS